MSQSEQELAIAALVNEMGGAGTPTPVVESEPTPQAPVEQNMPQVQPQVANVQQTPVVEENPQTQVSPEMLALMNGYSQMNDTLKTMQEQITQNNQPAVELTDQEMAMQELKEKLGFSDLESQNKELNNTITQMQQFIQQQQLQNEVAQFKAERPNANEQAIVEYISKMPQDMQQAMDNPDGWRMIDDLLSARSQPQSTPDPIVPSQQTQNTQPTDTFDRVKKGEKVSDLAIGDALLNAAGF